MEHDARKHHACMRAVVDFLDREPERRRLDQLMRQAGASFAVVYGRRRIGKTRLLLEWVDAHGGVYTVADRSDVVVQRRYFAAALASRIPGIADAEWRDWGALLAAVARGALAEGWRGPLVIDELPYLVEQSPELPSVLQLHDQDRRHPGPGDRGVRHPRRVGLGTGRSIMAVWRAPLSCGRATCPTDRRRADRRRR